MTRSWATSPLGRIMGMERLASSCADLCWWIRALLKLQSCHGVQALTRELAAVAELGLVVVRLIWGSD